MPDEGVELDLSAASPQDLADAGSAEDMVCSVPPTACQWFVYVDPNVDAGSVGDRYGWPPDGGEDPCAPCGFAARGVECGYCVVSMLKCGIAYTCEVGVCDPGCAGVGRRPAGLVDPVLASAGAMASWLARAAHLEAASIPAFAQLERELAAHGAPERLIAGARRARLDEVRHARIMADLARAAGARVPVVDVAPTVLRSLEEIAVDNAVEGCVREAIGAESLARRARATADPLLARVLAGIARDERRHGHLSWAIDAWARPRLPAVARRRVELARLRELRAVQEAT
jgi:hypothetical protein